MRQNRNRETLPVEEPETLETFPEKPETLIPKEAIDLPKVDSQLSKREINASLDMAYDHGYHRGYTAAMQNVMMVLMVALASLVTLYKLRSYSESK